MSDSGEELSGGFEKMRDEMERLMNEFFVSKNPLMSVSEGVWRPPTDVYETPESFVIRMEISGMNREDINVDLDGDNLVIHGTRQDRASGSKVKYHQMEIKYTRFERVIPMPPHYDETDVKAEYREGFLVVTIPKKTTESARARSIQVDINAGD